LFLFFRPAPIIRSFLSATGLTMLLPYIISNRSKWISCKLRVFALLNRQHEPEIEERKWVSRFVERIYTMSYISAIIIFIYCDWVVTRWQWLFSCKQNMKLVTTKFKSGGLHEKHLVATWNLGNHLSICF